MHCILPRMPQRWAECDLFRWWLHWVVIEVGPGWKIFTNFLWCRNWVLWIIVSYCLTVPQTFYQISYLTFFRPSDLKGSCCHSKMRRSCRIFGKVHNSRSSCGCLRSYELQHKHSQSLVMCRHLLTNNTDFSLNCLKVIHYHLFYPGLSS